MAGYLARARDPLSSLTHLCGALLSGAGLVFLLCKAVFVAAPARQALSGVLFALSLIALYTASAVYHYSGGGAHRLLFLRKLDHAMIYVLIAGTYTPILLGLLPAPRGAWLTAGIWCIAALGITLKLCWFSAPRWLQTALYLAMGWAILLDTSLFRLMAPGAIALLALGGLCYTVGGVIYMIKKPNPSVRFGFHELFHVWVLAGSIFHYLLVVIYLI